MSARAQLARVASIALVSLLFVAGASISSTSAFAVSSEVDGGTSVTDESALLSEGDALPTGVPETETPADPESELNGPPEAETVEPEAVIPAESNLDEPPTTSAATPGVDPQPEETTTSPVESNVASSGASASRAAAKATKKIVLKVAEVAGSRVDVLVTGSGFDDVKVLPGQTEPHVYLALIPKGTDLDTIGQGGLYPNISVSLPKDGAKKGTFAGTLTAPIDDLERTLSYEVISWPSRSNPADDSLYTRADVEIDWDALYPEDAVVLKTTVEKASKKAGLTVAFDAGNISEDLLGSQVTAALVEKGRKVTKSTQAAAFVRGTVGDDGTLSSSAVASPSKLDRIKSYDILLFSGTDFAQASAKKLARATVRISGDQWDAIFGAATPANVTIDKVALAKTGLRVDVSATGLPGDKIYVAVIERGSEGNLTQDSGYADFLYQPPVKNGQGSFTFVLSKRAIDSKKLYEVLIWQSHSNPSSSTIYGRADIQISAKQWARLAGTTPQKPAQPKPQKPASTGAAAPGSLSWGISSGFADYTTNPNRAGGKSGGQILTQGVGASGGAYLFPQAAGGSWDAQSQTGTVQFSGVVTFTAHKGLMNESFANPTISVSSASRGTITVSGRSFPLDLGSASKSVGQNGEVTWSNVPVSGAISGGSGGAGGSLAVDPLSFTVGTASQVAFASTSVGGDDTPKRTAAATAPTATGISVLTDAKKIKPGGRIEIEARGFDPSDKGVLVVLYADAGGEPLVLDEEATASATGLVSWSGTLPKEAVGAHTITFQGSINAGAVIDILEEDQAKKAAAKSPVVLTEQQEAQAAGVAPVAATPANMSTWEWWASAGGLVAIAACMTLLVIRQRKLAE